MVLFFVLFFKKKKTCANDTTPNTREIPVIVLERS